MSTEEDRAGLLRKIENMLARAEDKSLTEEERSSYAAKAMDWMGKYAIQEHELGSVTDKPRKMLKMNLNVKYANGWRVHLADAVASNCGAYCTFIGRINRITFWGQEHMVLGAQMVAEYLLKTVEDLSKDHARTTGTGTKGRRDFAEGCAHRLIRRVHESFNLSADTRLPVIMKSAVEEGKNFLLESTGKKEIKPSSRLGEKRSGHTESYWDGRDAGDTVDLRGHSRQKQIS